MISATLKATDWARVSEVINSAISPNDDYPSPAQIAKHRTAQLEYDERQPNHMKHLHVFTKSGFVALAATVDIMQSFELATRLTVHYCERGSVPVWLIEGPNCSAALFVALGSTGRMVAQPFEHDHFVAVSIDVASQTINESSITDTCDLGCGIIFHVGTRDGAPVYVMQNDDVAGMCAVWYDDHRPH